MTRTRLLVVDDSVVVRALLVRLLADVSDLEIVGIASNGRVALDRLVQLSPDIVLLDIEMPELDGLGLLRELRSRRVHLPIIVFSSLTERGAAITIEALSLGASDYVTKPSQIGGMKMSLEDLKTILVDKVRALAKRQRGVVRELPRFERTEPKKRMLPVEVIALGASTGGPPALAELVPQLPASLPVPMLVVQHMPALFTGPLARTLANKSAIKVVEARHGQVLERGVVYIAPGDQHMVVERRITGEARVALHQGERVNSCRPSVDVLFTSVAKAFGRGVLAVVLTGMGSDGLRGAGLIKEEGGVVVAQDEATSVVWGMPGAVAQAGLTQAVLPLDKIASYLLERMPAHDARRGVT